LEERIQKNQNKGQNYVTTIPPFKKRTWTGNDNTPSNPRETQQMKPIYRILRQPDVTTISEKGISKSLKLGTTFQNRS
jgi:hypothetical protein